MKIIFIDRDGVVNKDLYSYVTNWTDFDFLNGSLKALKKLTDNGYEIVIISNQGGVSRGDYTIKELNVINKNMLEEIEKVAKKRPSTYYCIHRDEDNCDCRKPKTGLFKQAESKFGKIDYKNTYFIGDQERDIEAAKNIRAKSILVLSGRTEAPDLEGWKIRPDFIKKDLLDAANWLIEGSR